MSVVENTLECAKGSSFAKALSEIVLQTNARRAVRRCVVHGGAVRHRGRLIGGASLWLHGVRPSVWESQRKASICSRPIVRAS